MVSNFSKRSVNIVEVLNMKTCKICGCSFDEENFEGVVVNEGIDNEYHVCCDCVPLFPVKPAVHIPRVRSAGKMW